MKLHKTLSLVAALLAPAMAAQASQLVPQNLKQMIERAELIVTGDVAQVRDGIEGGVPYTEITLTVRDSHKRDLAAGSRYSFRQYGLLKPRRMADGRTLLPARIEGMPRWTVGEKVTTFLNKPSAQSGLTVPVGLAQGKLSASGGQVANAFDNRGLFTGMSVDAAVLKPGEAEMLANRRGGPVEGALLRGLVHRAVKEQWIAKGVMR